MWTGPTEGAVQYDPETGMVYPVSVQETDLTATVREVPP